MTQSFDDERIGELEGDFGLPGMGVPEEVDCLTLAVGDKTVEIRVANRGISLFTAETEELLRLHRFFCV